MKTVIVTLTFSNTFVDICRWMKKNLKRGGGGSSKSKQATQEELRQRERLHRKIMSKPQSNLDHSKRTKRNSSDEDISSNDSDDVDESVLRRQAVGLITEVERDVEHHGLANQNNDQEQVAKKGVMGMKFMQRSLQRRKEAALNDARELLEEIDKMDGGKQKASAEGEQLWESTGMPEVVQIDEPNTANSATKKLASRRTFNGVSDADSIASKNVGKTKKDCSSSEAKRVHSELLPNSQQTTSVAMGTGVITMVAPATITIANGTSENQLLDGAWDDKQEWHADNNDRVDNINSATSLDNHSVDAVSAKIETTKSKDDGNPWLKGNHLRRKRSHRLANHDSSNNSAIENSDTDCSKNEVAEAVQRLTTNYNTKPKSDQHDNNKNIKLGNSDSREIDASHLSQAEIVARAFSNGSASDFRKEFEQKKLQDAELEIGIGEAPKAISGWGTWAGLGVSLLSLC